VLDGVAVGFFGRTYVAEDLARGALVELKLRDLPRFTRSAALVRGARAGEPSAPGRALVEALEAQARTLGLLRRRPRGAGVLPVR
jgi:hypothetical protein